MSFLSVNEIFDFYVIEHARKYINLELMRNCFHNDFKLMANGSKLLREDACILTKK